MSSASAKFLFIVMLFFVAYVWWLVSWSFFDGPSVNQRTYIPQTCGFFAGDVPDAVESCCGEREASYWEGGSLEFKQQVDLDFSQCLVQASYASNLRSSTVFVLRPYFGTPYLHTPWRWGNGWSFGKGYRP